MGVRGDTRLVGRRKTRDQPHRGSGCGFVWFPPGSTPPGTGTGTGTGTETPGVGTETPGAGTETPGAGRSR